ncbi:2-amino-4-hydroxy-6-hydroxymethyldihydropteridine diphosphokinase [Erythrobacter sp. W53]|uniref:2-amino-4-hydroxy-6- hydroxymethyldihydropteridine diphosphokinase n=1 Tax=Erythrobacter sp. W53 TaxID=3425947 RepID=UPI003D767292
MSGIHHYLIALGSNMRSPRFGTPRQIVRAACGHIENAGAEICALSPIIRSRPIGPSAREFANAAAVVAAPLTPRAMLAMLQDIEKQFGRKRSGQAWRARVLDLDIALWSGGIYDELGLQIPHPGLRERPFVLGPASTIAPHWRDPISRLSLAQLNARLTRPQPLSK